MTVGADDKDGSSAALVRALRSKAAGLEDKLDDAEEKHNDTLKQLTALQGTVASLRSQLAAARELRNHVGSWQNSLSPTSPLYARNGGEAEQEQDISDEALQIKLFEQSAAFIKDGRQEVEEFAGKLSEAERLGQQKLLSVREELAEARAESLKDRGFSVALEEESRRAATLASECESQKEELASMRRELEVRIAPQDEGARVEASSLALEEQRSRVAILSSECESQQQQLTDLRRNLEARAEQQEEGVTEEKSRPAFEEERSRANELAIECESQRLQLASLQRDMEVARLEDGAAEKHQQGELQSARAEVEKLTKQFDDAKCHATEQLEKVAAHAEEYAEARRCVDSAEALVADLREQIIAERNKAQDFEQHLRDARSAHETELKRHMERLEREEESFRRQLEGFTVAHQAAESVVANERQAREEESTRARAAHGVLQANLDAAQSAHEALFGRYSAAVDELDGLKNEKKRVAEERDKLLHSLNEAERVRKELEDAEPPGPAQLSVSDVLISVAFEGIGSPLELRPWDTNLDNVVTSWLECVQRSRAMQPSLVRYLRHLEDTSETFPVRVVAKLVEVHEKFSM